MSKVDWSRLLSPYQPERVDCPFTDVCRGYPTLCGNCANNRAAKRSYFRLRRWKP